MDQGVQESVLRKTLDNKALWPYGHGSSLPLSKRVLEAGDGRKQDLRVPYKKGADYPHGKSPRPQLQSREVNASA